MKIPFFKRIFMSFSGKLFAFMVSVIILLTCTFSLFSLHSQQESFEKDMMLDGMMHARMLRNGNRLTDSSTLCLLAMARVLTIR